MTQQPPGGGDETYAQPQDPWAGHFEPGLASVPTDPIPQGGAGYQPAPDVWSQPTVLHGNEPYPYVPQQPRRGGLGVILLVLVAVLILGGGGGYAAYRVLTSPTGTTSPPPPTHTTSASPSSTALTTPSTFPYTAQVGDCVYNAGTKEKPSLQPSDCGRAGSYKIVRKKAGPGIPTAADGSFDRDTTAVSVCAGITYQTWYGYQTGTPALDLFFCMTNN